MNLIYIKLKGNKVKIFSVNCTIFFIFLELSFKHVIFNTYSDICIYNRIIPNYKSKSKSKSKSLL